LDTLKRSNDEERKVTKLYREQLITLFDYLRLPQLGPFDPMMVDDYLKRLVAMVSKGGNTNGSRQSELNRRNDIVNKVLEEYENTSQPTSS
jgi:hypothetical protein